MVKLRGLLADGASRQSAEMISNAALTERAVAARVLRVGAVVHEDGLIDEPEAKLASELVSVARMHAQARMRDVR